MREACSYQPPPSSFWLQFIISQLQIHPGCLPLGCQSWTLGTFALASKCELKPCPFCGGEAKAFYCEESGTFDVQCQVCGAIPYIGYRRSGMSPDEVIEAWNRRANDE